MRWTVTAAMEQRVRVSGTIVGVLLTILGIAESLGSALDGDSSDGRRRQQWNNERALLWET